MATQKCHARQLKHLFNYPMDSKLYLIVWIYLTLLHFQKCSEKLTVLPLTGRPGGLGLGDMLWPSAPPASSTGRPNMASSSLASGGGMG